MKPVRWIRLARWFVACQAAWLSAADESPLARIDVQSDRLVMVVGSCGYFDLPLPAQAVRRRGDGTPALDMPLSGRNFLPPEVAGDASDGDGAAPGRRLSVGAEASWTGAPVRVQHAFEKTFCKPGRFGLLFSAYVRRPEGPPATVALTLDWRPESAKTNVTATVEVPVDAAWKRVFVRLPFDDHAAAGLAIPVLTAASGIEAGGLQIEPWGDYPGFTASPTPWMPGGTVRRMRPPTLSAAPIPTDWREGSVALRVRADVPAEGASLDGERTILFVGGYWRGVLELMTDGAWVGKTRLRLPGLRDLLADGNEHTVLLTWNRAEVRVAADGRELGHAPVKEPMPQEDRMGYRIWIGTHNPRMRNFGGDIREIRFFARPVTPTEAAAALADRGPWIEPPPRRVFRRDEEDVALVLPLRGEEQRGAKVELDGLPEASARVVRQSGGYAIRIDLQPWRLPAGERPGTIRLIPREGEPRLWPWTVTIVPAEARDRFPVGNWGSPGSTNDLAWARDLGLGVIDSRNHEADYLNRVAVYGLRASVNFASMQQEPHPAIPEHLEHVASAAVLLARALAPFPWVTTCIHNSEGQGRDDIALAPTAMQRLKRDLSLTEPPIPPQERWADLAVRPKVDLSRYAATGIVPDEDRSLRYVSWLLRRGDGMDIACGITAAAVHQSAPWVRMVQEPARVHYAGWADTLSNWRYANAPAPMLAVWLQGLAAAQAAGKTYYPLTGHCYYTPQIRLNDPTKTVVPPSGDMAAAFLWTGLLLPASEIRCFGWWQKDWEANERLRPGGSARIRDAIAEVTRIGPVAGDMPLRPAPLAILIPEANRLGRAHDEWFHAYNGLINALASYFVENDLPVDFLLEDQVLDGGLKPYRALYVPALRYQRASVDRAIQAWRRQGGRLVLDNEAGPAFASDATAALVSTNRKGMAFAIDPAGCEAFVRAFRGGQPTHARVESGQALVRTKEQPGMRLVVAVNNGWRETVLGRGLTGAEGGSDIVDVDRELKEQGRVRQLSAELKDTAVAQTLTLSLLEEPGAAVYDLRAGRRLALTAGTNGRQRVNIGVAPGDAAVLAIYDQVPSALSLEAPRELRAGDRGNLDVRLLDAQGRAVRGRQGVDIEVRDPSGNRFDASAVYRLTDGRTTIRLRLPVDAPAGVWRITARDLASGLQAAGEVTVVSLGR